MDSFDQIRAGWAAQVKLTMALLQEEKALEEIVRLVGIDTLSYSDRVKLLTTQMIREDFLHQNAFDEIDTFTSLDKQYRMLNIILLWHQLASQAVLDNKSFSAIELMKTKQRIGRLKYVVENEFDKVYEQLLNDLQAEFEQLESE